MSGTFTDPTTPNISDYTTFLRNIGIGTTYLPDSSQWITSTFNVAIDTVNTVLSLASGLAYTLAVYNLGADRLINYAIDVQGQNYFTQIRQQFGITNFSPGMVSASSDEGTGESLLNPEFMKTMTMGDLQMTKTPYGRQYMAFAQEYGPTIWGLT